MSDERISHPGLPGSLAGAAALLLIGGAVGPAAAGAALQDGPPIIALSAERLEFTAELDEDPPDQEIELTNAGGGRLKWEASVDVEWLRVSPDDGDLRAGRSRDLRIRVDSDDLEPGDYAGTITVTGNAPNSPQTVAVVLAVLGRAVLELTAETLRLELDEGDGPAERSVAVRNAGEGVLDWAAAAEDSWVSVVPASGRLEAGESVDVTIGVASELLDPGSHSTTVTFDGNARNVPLSVGVEVTILTEFTLEQMVAALAGAETLSEGQARFLDRQGNDNGRFDLGDFLAWLDGGSPPGAGGDDGDGDDDG